MTRGTNGSSLYPNDALLLCEIEMQKKRIYFVFLQSVAHNHIEADVR